MEGSDYQRVLHGWQTVGFGPDDWSNIDLSQNKKAIRFIQKKTKGKTTKSKVEIPIHKALEEHLLSGPTSGAPNAPVFPELHGKPGSGKSGLSMAFKRIMAKAGVDAGVIRERSGAAGRSVSALSFHSLRTILLPIKAPTVFPIIRVGLTPAQLDSIALRAVEEEESRFSSRLS